MTHISADIFGGQKSLVKPVMRQKSAIISSCSVLPLEIVMHDAYIGGCSENNIKYVVIYNDLGRKNRTTRYNCRFSAASLALRVTFQFHRCGTYLVLSRSPSHDNNKDRVYA